MTQKVRWCFTRQNPSDHVAVSNSIVVYLRLLTSAQIRIDPEAYAPFLFHPELGEQMDTREFCENFVEAVGKEAGGAPLFGYPPAEFGVDLRLINRSRPDHRIDTRAASERPCRVPGW